MKFFAMRPWPSPLEVKGCYSKGKQSISKILNLKAFVFISPRPKFPLKKTSSVVILVFGLWHGSCVGRDQQGKAGGINGIISDAKPE
jgi:hypothetical protein